MTVFTCILLTFLVVCAVTASLSKNLLNTILIFMSYSLVMSIIWILLESPDLAITEAAVGAGVTTVLFLVTLKKIHAILRQDEAESAKKKEDGAQSKDFERKNFEAKNLEKKDFEKEEYEKKDFGVRHADGRGQR